MRPAPKHVVKRYGKAYQLRIETEQDVERLDEFGIHHWIATSAPAASFQCDPRFLAFLDADGNGRIRVDEVLLAKRWIFKCLRNRARMMRGEDSVVLDDLDTFTPEGQNLHVAAMRLLTNLGHSETSPITLADVRDKKKLLMQSGSNGDGIIPPGALTEPDFTEYVEDIIKTVGGVDDLTGAKGVDEEHIERFHAEAESYLAWVTQSHLPPGQTSSPLMPLGEATGQAYYALAAVRDKINEFFAQCRLVRVDPSSMSLMRLPEAKLKEMNPDDTAALAAFAAQAPLQSPNAGEVLAFDETINPVHAEALERVRVMVLQPMLGREVAALSRAEWLEVNARFGPYEKWLAEKKGTVVEPLGEERLRTYLAGEYREKVMGLIEADKTVANELKYIDELERLLLYQRYFVRFLNNFVNLYELYDPHIESMMDMGTVIIDGRVFSLVLRVLNRPAHVAIARNSGMFLMYLEATNKGSSDRFEVVCPVTRGRPDTLFVGKRGVMIDTFGVEWDVKVVEIVAQPISVAQAAIAPFRRAMAFVEGKVEGLSTAREREWEAGLGKTTEDTEKAMRERVQSLAASAPAQAPSKATTAAGRRDMLIGGSIAVAALGSAWAFIAKTLTQLGWLEIGIALLASALVVIVPTSVVAILKLRRRNLGALLEAAEWAINEPLRVTPALARLLTEHPKLPSGTRKEREDTVLKFARAYKNTFRIIAKPLG